MNWLSVAEISKLTRIPAPTARRYASLFKEFLPGKKMGRVTKYPEDTVRIFERISALYGEGKVTVEIEEVLRKDFARTIDVDIIPDTTEQSSSPAVGGPSPMDIARSLSNVMDKFGATLDVLADQKTSIDGQQEDIRKLKTAFVLLARSRREQAQLPAAPARDELDALRAENAELRSRLERLEKLISES